MLESRPSRSPGRAVGVLLLVCLIALDISLLTLLLTEPITLVSFLWGLLLLASAPGLMTIVFWTRNLGAARYLVEGNTLIIDWGRLSHRVSLSQIESFHPGREVSLTGRFRGLRWPGYMVGNGQVAVAGRELPAVFYASRPLEQQVVLVTPARAIGLSPVDPAEFSACLEALRDLEGEAAAEASGPSLRFPGWQLWQDRTALGLAGLSVGLNLALFAYLSSLFSRLPAEVPLHFSRSGSVDRVGGPGNFFLLALIGLLAWLVAAGLAWFFYAVRGERPLGYIVWGSAAVVQLGAWVALAYLLASL
ncbi:MAG: PH domain-containing protein [Candidatus Promineifilaceae bacterium]